MPSALDVANFFLLVQDDEAGDTISNLKLQKMCYYAQGFTLAITGRPLFTEEIQAWGTGPVIPDLYHRFKKYQNGSIPKPERSFADIRESFSSEQLEILDEVQEVYGQYSAWKLRNLTHGEKPWQDAWDKDPYCTVAIPHDAMKSYFKGQLV